LIHRPDGLFAVDASPRRAAMAPMGIDQPILRDLPQPQMKRHRRIFQVIVQAAIGFDQHILHNIAGIHSTLHHAVHSQIDHPPQRFAVTIEQPVNRCSVAGFRLAEKFLRLGMIGPHEQKSEFGRRKRDQSLLPRIESSRRRQMATVSPNTVDLILSDYTALRPREFSTPYHDRFSH
jgi:hypothetical protein